MRLAGKIGLVTGAAGGIGSAVARMAAREGAKIVVTDLAEEAGQALAGGTGGVFLRHDVSSFADWERIVAQVVDQHGRIDFLAHCAGIEGGYLHAGVDTPLDVWDRVIKVNLTGSFYACKSVYPAMLKQGVGSVVLVSSIVSMMATSSGVAYGASKAGVEHLARSFAAIGWKNKTKVRCNSVHPGAIKTRMTDQIFAELAQGANVDVSVFEEGMKNVLPMGDRGEPDDIAHMVIYLASDEAKYASGAAYKVDGGWSVVDVG